MNTFAWILIVYLALDALASIALIGRPRKTVTPGFAVAVSLVSLFLIGLVVLVAA